MGLSLRPSTSCGPNGWGVNHKGHPKRMECPLSITCYFLSYHYPLGGTVAHLHQIDPRRHHAEMLCFFCLVEGGHQAPHHVEHANPLPSGTLHHNATVFGRLEVVGLGCGEPCKEQEDERQ